MQLTKIDVLDSSHTTHTKMSRELPDDYDSSDEDFGPPPPDRWAHLGKKSIENMVANAVEDRIASKKNAENLQQVTGTPKAQMNRATVWNRFSKFYVESLNHK